MLLSKKEQDRLKAEAAMLYMRTKASLDALSEELERAVSGPIRNK